jgi:DNA-binding XRE family transcriptional regulator
MQQLPKVDFAKLCKELREKGKWTQQEIADMLGVHIVTYKRWEAGKIEPNAQAAFQICCIWHEQKNKKPSKNKSISLKN